MGNNSNALFRTGIEPFQECHRSSATVFIGLTFISIKGILVAVNLGEVKVGEFRVDFLNGSTSVANIVSEPFSTLFSHQKSRSSDFDSNGMLDCTNGGFAFAKKRGKTGLTRMSKHMQGRLAGPCKR
jgi:hypothetical protein